MGDVEGDDPRFTKLCQELAENRPESLKVSFHETLANGYWVQYVPPEIGDTTWARSLGQALKENSVVTTLEVNAHAMTVAAVGGITRFIARSVTLENLNLRNDLSIEAYGERSATIENRILFAASANGKLHSLCVPKEFGAFALETCLRANQGSLRKLKLGFGIEDCLVTEQMVDDAASLAESFALLTSIEELHLHGWGDLDNVAPIISQFIDHPKLQTLTCERNIAADVLQVGRAIRDLLLSSTPLIKLHINITEDDPNENVLDILRLVCTITKPFSISLL